MSRRLTPQGSIVVAERRDRARDPCRCRRRRSSSPPLSSEPRPELSSSPVVAEPGPELGDAGAGVRGRGGVGVGSGVALGFGGRASRLRASGVGVGAGVAVAVGRERLAGGDRLGGQADRRLGQRGSWRARAPPPAAG